MTRTKEERLAIMETQVAQINAGFSELKADLREIKNVLTLMHSNDPTAYVTRKEFDSAKIDIRFLKSRYYIGWGIVIAVQVFFGLVYSWDKIKVIFI